MPLLKKLQKKHEKQGFAIVGISFDDDRKALDAMVAKKGLPWPQLYFGKRWDNEMAVLYNIQRTPTNHVLDREGKLVAKDVPEKELIAAIEKALGK